MKKILTRILSAVFCLAVAVCGFTFAGAEIHGANYPTLFYNDRPWYLATRLPAENVYGTNYLPITMFAQLPSVDVRINKTLGTFIITHGNNYLSFDTKSNFAANQDKLRMYITTAEYHGERYVPAKIVCTYLGLEYEELTDRKTGEIAIRIADSNKTKTFRELLSAYHPDFTPKESGNVDRPVLSERTIYLGIDMSDIRYADAILKSLSRYNFKVTFFLSGSALEASPTLLAKIAAGGHGIAVGATGNAWSGFDTADDIIDYITEKNIFLARAIRRKSNIIGLPAAGRAVIGEETAAALNEAGYFTWGGDTKISAATSASTGAATVMNAIRNYKTSEINLTAGANTAGLLDKVLSFINDNRSVCDVKLITPLAILDKTK